jgi:hypothetical protein
VTYTLYHARASLSYRSKRVVYTRRPTGLYVWHAVTYTLYHARASLSYRSDRAVYASAHRGASRPRPRRVAARALPANDAEIRVPTRVPIPDANDPRDDRASTRFDFDNDLITIRIANRRARCRRRARRATRTRRS